MVSSLINSLAVSANVAQSTLSFTANAPQNSAIRQGFGSESQIGLARLNNGGLGPSRPIQPVGGSLCQRFLGRTSALILSALLTVGCGRDAEPTAVGPTIVRPTMGMMLPPTKAFLLWKDGEIPAGRSIAEYEICVTTGAAFNDDIDCPNKRTPTNHFVLKALVPGSTYRWKVRARFDDGSVSSYSEVYTFSM